MKTKKILLILWAASKIAITRKWLNPELPTFNEWINITQKIHTMEKLTYTLRIHKDIFH